MKRALEFGPHAALARHPKLVAAAIGLAMLLFASAAAADNRGTAKNPILLPGTETTLPRVVAPPRHERVVLHEGAFEATLYSLPTLARLPGTRPRLSQDTRPMGAAARARLDAGQTGDVDVGGTGLKLSVQPAWDVEVEGRDVALGDTANPATLLRTRGVFRMAAVGVELRF